MWHFKRTIYFFCGVVLGFMLCCIAGFITSQTIYFKHFTRFFAAIQPAMHYYPTAHELLNTAEHHLQKNKIIVVVGGNSIFKGIGQKHNELWTDALQQELGDQFQVLNFAMDGAAFNAFGGTVYRMLHERYPRVLFVTTCVPESALGSDQHTYDYVYWDAYYKKLFNPDKNERKMIQTKRKEDLHSLAGQNLHLLSVLDSHFYFRNLWNAIGYHIGFTIWTDQSAHSLFKARKKYHDLGDDAILHLEKTQILDVIQQDEQLLNKGDSRLLLRESEHRYREWPLADRRHTLCVIPTLNPKMVNQFSPVAKHHYFAILQQLSGLLGQLGYHAMIMPTFANTDYVDTRHLNASGGKKLATQIANEVRTRFLRTSV